MAKNDEIEQLKDQLEKERESLRESQKLVANVREELQIKESMLQQSQAERDALQTKTKEFIFKLQQMQDKL